MKKPNKKELLQWLDTIEKLNKENGITVIHITHNMEEAVRADRVIVVSDGRTVLDGTPREVFSDVEKIKSLGLDVPQATELAYKLHKSGFPVDYNVLNETECAQSVLKALGVQ